jgi:hypothetical protein
MWSAQLVDMGRITPLKPSASSLASGQVQVFVAPAHLLAGHDLALAKTLLRRRTPSTASIALMAPRMYST